MALRLDQPPEEVFPALAEAALIDRRMALKLMAASAALAAASCGPQPGEELAGAGDFIPEDRPTTLDHDGLGFGIVVRTVGGNPVKIEGHPLHPASLGRSTVWAQAALLAHYDPERMRQPLVSGKVAEWAQVRAFFANLSANAVARRGAGLHLLVQPTASPTLERMVAAVRTALPLARIHAHRPVALAGSTPDLDADFILSFGDDFLGAGPAQVLNAARFIEARRARLAAGGQHRLVVVEPVPTLTGARADLRIARDPAGMVRLAQALAGLGPGDPDAERVAAVLRQAQKPTVLIGEQTPAYLHQALAALPRQRPRSPDTLFSAEVEGVDTLVAAAREGRIDTLMILGGNPAYDAPRGLGFQEALGRPRTTVYVGAELNETALACGTRIPAAGLLTGWGDLRGVEGTVSLVRPVAGRFGMTHAQALAALIGLPASAELLVRQTHGFTGDWEALPGGIILGEAPAAGPVPVPTIQAPAPPEPQPEGLTLVLRAAYHVHDGSHAGNAWLQELPDPITGLAWGNAATLAPETAERLGIAAGELIEIELDGAAVTAPVEILPGQAAETVSLSLGYGRRTGAVAAGVGTDAYPLASGGLVRGGARVARIGPGGQLIYPNWPFRPDEENAVRWVEPGGTVARAPEGPSFVRPDYGATKQWGMVIDLDACIGCNACTIACQAENNVPVVGPEEVRRGRVMHWIRVDRHDNSQGRNGTAYQPIPCMHCETAPCEPVCPVGATSHSSDGLNQMTYQRCIGTRSCSNNCPYKVRRFNWFDYQKRDLSRPDPSENPRVSVRDAGVMEKCTYCVQRIEAARVEDEGRTPLPACAQACPTQAIQFGDISDPADPVARARASDRNYALLDGNNLMPRTTYLAKVDGGRLG